MHAGVGDANEVRLGAVEPASGLIAPEEDAVRAAGQQRELAQEVLALVELADLADGAGEESVEELRVFGDDGRCRLDAPGEGLAEGQQHLGMLEAQLPHALGALADRDVEDALGGGAPLLHGDALVERGEADELAPQESSSEPASGGFGFSRPRSISMAMTSGPSVRERVRRSSSASRSSSREIE